MINSQLIELLSQMDPDAEVRLAIQPAHPLQLPIEGISSSRDVSGDEDEDEEASEIVWIVQGEAPSRSEMNPYISEGVWEVLRHF